MTSTATDVVAAALRPQTVRLTVAEDCDADGATCTEDKRKLSNSLNFTVTGPVEGNKRSKHIWTDE